MPLPHGFRIIPTSKRRSAGLLLLACASIGCGEPPVPVDARTGEVLDPKYRPPAAPKEVAGNVRLRGDLAKAEQGTVFVILREQGSRVPARLRSYVYGGTEISDEKAGERVLAFKLTDNDVVPGMSGPMPVKPELRVVYSPDGKIGTSSPHSKELRVAYGSTDIEITLP